MKVKKLFEELNPINEDEEVEVKEVETDDWADKTEDEEDNAQPEEDTNKERDELNDRLKSYKSNKNEKETLADRIQRMFDTKVYNEKDFEKHYTPIAIEAEFGKDAAEEYIRGVRATLNSLKDAPISLVSDNTKTVDEEKYKKKSSDGKEIVDDKAFDDAIKLALYKALEVAESSEYSGFDSTKAADQRMNVLLYGPSGVAKTALVREWAKKNNILLVVMHGGMLTADDFAGIPVKVRQKIGKDLYQWRIKSLRNGAFDSLSQDLVSVEANTNDWGPRGCRGIVMFLDEVSRCPKKVSDDLLAVINDHLIRDPQAKAGMSPLNYLFCIGAMNEDDGVNEVKDPDEALARRFTNHVGVKADKRVAREFFLDKLKKMIAGTERQYKRLIGMKAIGFDSAALKNGKALADEADRLAGLATIVDKLFSPESKFNIEGYYTSDDDKKKNILSSKHKGKAKSYKLATMSFGEAGIEKNDESKLFYIKRPLNYRMLNSIIFDPEQDGTPEKFEEIFCDTLMNDDEWYSFGGIDNDGKKEHPTTSYVDDIEDFFDEQYDTIDAECDYAETYAGLLKSKNPDSFEQEASEDELANAF